MQTCCLIPCYNAAPYLKRCLRSTHEFDRTILWDDGSTDQSLQIALQFPHVEVYSSHHEGVQATRNKLYEHSQGYDLIAYLDADDCRFPGGLAEAKAVLKTQPHVDAIYSPIIINGHSIPTPPDIIHAILSIGVQTNGFLIRRSAIARAQEQLGYVWRDVPIRHEHFLAFDLLRTGTHFQHIPVPAAVYHPNIGFSHKLDGQVFLAAYNQLTREIKDYLGDRWQAYDRIAHQAETSFRHWVANSY